MNEEEFKNYIDNNINSISSKISLEEINFLGNLVNAFNEVCEKYYKLQNNWGELKKFIEKELDRLVRECSQIYEDGLGKTRLVNEDIFNEVKNISNKVQELEQGKDERKDSR